MSQDGQVPRITVSNSHTDAVESMLGRIQQGWTAIDSDDLTYAEEVVVDLLIRAGLVQARWRWVAHGSDDTRNFLFQVQGDLDICRQEVSEQFVEHLKAAGWDDGYGGKIVMKFEGYRLTAMGEDAKRDLHFLPDNTFHHVLQFLRCDAQGRRGETACVSLIEAECLAESGVDPPPAPALHQALAKPEAKIEIEVPDAEINATDTCGVLDSSGDGGLGISAMSKLKRCQLNAWVAAKRAERNLEDVDKESVWKYAKDNQSDLVPQNRAAFHRYVRAVDAVLPKMTKAEQEALIDRIVSDTGSVE